MTSSTASTGVGPYERAWLALVEAADERDRGHLALFLAAAESGSPEATARLALHRVAAAASRRIPISERE